MRTFFKIVGQETQKTEISDLSIGDFFVAFEGDGTPILGDNGEKYFRTISIPVKNEEDDTWEIDCVPVKFPE